MLKRVLSVVVQMSDVVI